MEDKNVSFGTFKIASAYIGTVIGAGFASGQEVLQFFSAYGWLGLFGVLTSSLLFFLVGYSVLRFGYRLNASTHLQIVRLTNGRFIGTLIDAIITIFLFGALAAMIAGAGAIFEEQFHTSAIWGTLAMALVTLLTVIAGTRGVVNSMSVVVPFLLTSVLFISIYSLVINPIEHGEIGLTTYLPGATPNWFLSSLNYASYNMIIAIAVLAPMGAKALHKKNLFAGALFGALGLGLGIVAIYFCVLTNISDVFYMQVPMIGIAAKISPAVQFVFAIMLFAAVYTTAVGNLFGFSRRISPDVPKKTLIAVTTLIAFFVAQLGFSNMVRYLYPAVGYGGLLFLLGVAYTWLTKRDAIK